MIAIYTDFSILTQILHDNANNVQFIVIMTISALQWSFASLGPKRPLSGVNIHNPSKLNIIPLLSFNIEAKRRNRRVKTPAIRPILTLTYQYRPEARSFNYKWLEYSSFYNLHFFPDSLFNALHIQYRFYFSIV